MIQKTNTHTSCSIHLRAFGYPCFCFCSDCYEIKGEGCLFLHFSMALGAEIHNNTFKTIIIDLERERRNQFTKVGKLIKTRVLYMSLQWVWLIKLLNYLSSFTSNSSDIFSLKILTKSNCLRSFHYAYTLAWINKHPGSSKRKLTKLHAI